MRIAYVLTEFPALSETFVVNECELLGRAGVDVLPLSFRTSRYRKHFDTTMRDWDNRTLRPSPAALPSLTRLTRRFPDRMRTATDILREHRSANIRETVASWGGLAWCAQAAEHVMDAGIAHVHAHFARGAATLAWLTSVLAGVDFSFTAHAFGVYGSHPEGLAKKVAAARFVRASHAEIASVLRTVSGLSADDPKIVEIPTPLDLDAVRLRPARPRGERIRLLTVARIVPKKGLEQLPDVLAALEARGLDCELHLIGPGQAGALASCDRIVLHGACSHDRVLSELHRADLFVLPCRVTDSGDRDGLPVALLEAFASGVPAISTRVAGIPELFGCDLDHQLAAPDDPVALAAAIAALLADDARYQRAGELQRHIVEARFGPACLEPLMARFACP